MATESLSDRIRRLRNRAELSIPQVAERCTKLGSKISRQSVSKWESGETQNLKLSNLEAFAQVVGVSIEEVISSRPMLAPEDPYPVGRPQTVPLLSAYESRRQDEIDAAASLLRSMDKADRDACLQLIHTLATKQSQGTKQSRRKS